MKIYINYDLINAVKNVNENFSLNKLVRNKKMFWLKYNLPLLTAVEIALFRNEFLENLPTGIFINLFSTAFIELTLYMAAGDMYKADSEIKLKSLVPKLQDLNINTDYKLLLESKEEGKVNNLFLNDKKIPQIKESKYILVPSYDYRGDIKDTSILQEHILGTKDYTLSIGSRSKVYKFAYSNA